MSTILKTIETTPPPHAAGSNGPYEGEYLVASESASEQRCQRGSYYLFSKRPAKGDSSMMMASQSTSSAIGTNSEPTSGQFEC